MHSDDISCPFIFPNSLMPLLQLPDWEEETNAGHVRFANTFTAVADKFAEENVFCISHGKLFVSIRFTAR